MTIREVIQKYFKEERQIYFQSSDAHAMIEGDTYLRFEWHSDKVEIWFGGNSGECCLISTNQADKLETLIRAIIY